MNGEKQLISLYSWINDCWKLALSYDARSDIKDELELPEIIVTSWTEDGWINAYNNIDNIIKKINRLVKERPEYTYDCRILKFKLNMIKEGVKHTLEKEFGLKIYCRNGELII